MNAEDIRDSVEEFTKAIDQAQIIMFPGGFSAGDEPEGSAKFFATAFRNAKMTEAVMKLLNERDGLALGICNGFQALIKLGLVPYGEIRPQTADSPTLTYNTIGRHISKMVYTKVVTNKSRGWHRQRPARYIAIRLQGQDVLSLRRNGWRSCLQTVRWQHSMSTRRVFRPWMKSGMSTAPTWRSRESQARTEECSARWHIRSVVTGVWR